VATPRALRGQLNSARREARFVATPSYILSFPSFLSPLSSSRAAPPHPASPLPFLTWHHNAMSNTARGTPCELFRPRTPVPSPSRHFFWKDALVASLETTRTTGGFHRAWGNPTVARPSHRARIPSATDMTVKTDPGEAAPQRLGRANRSVSAAAITTDRTRASGPDANACQGARLSIFVNSTFCRHRRQHNTPR
jgi:hypothetical protein